MKTVDGIRVFTPEDMKPTGGTTRDPCFSWHRTLPGWPQVDAIPYLSVWGAADRGKSICWEAPWGMQRVLEGVLVKGGFYFAVTSAYSSGS